MNKAVKTNTDAEAPKAAKSTNTIDESGVRSMIGQRIKKVREERQYTQNNLAKAIADRVGACSRQAVAQWERGAASPSYGMMGVISRVLDCDPGYIAFGNGGADNSKARIVGSSIESALVSVPEIEFGDEADERSVVRHWGIPKEVISEIVGDRSDAQKAIFIVSVGSRIVEDEYPAGSRAYVDPTDLRPDGSVMAYWDGFGIAFAYASPALGAGVKSIKLHGKDFEQVVPAEELTLLGKLKRRA